MREFGGSFEKLERDHTSIGDLQSQNESKTIYNRLFSDDFSDVFVEKEEKPKQVERRLESELKMEPSLVLKRIFGDDFEESSESHGDSNQEKGDTLNEGKKEEEKEIDLTGTYEPNSKIEVNGNTYETDDKGKIYKINGTELTANTEYELEGIKYRTDEQGRIVSCDARLVSTPEGKRDNRAQEIAGGKDREANDQGSHVIARIFGGPKGIENMLALRDKINQGPYKTMENEIKKALEQGKDVRVHVDIEYEADSERPLKIRVTYTIDGETTVIEYDNEVGSTDLMDSVEKQVDEDLYNDLKDEIRDAKEDGENVSVIAVKVEYDEDGNVKEVVVVVRYEGENGTGYNDYRHMKPKEDGE